MRRVIITREALIPNLLVTLLLSLSSSLSKSSSAARQSSVSKGAEAGEGSRKREALRPGPPLGGLVSVEARRGGGGRGFAHLGQIWRWISGKEKSKAATSDTEIDILSKESKK